MSRPEIDLIIPVEKTSAQLDKTLGLIEQYTKNFNLILVNEPDLNVSEARQKAMDEMAKNRVICFLDYDSEMIHPEWLDAMYETLQRREDAGAVFAGEWWGTEEEIIIDTSKYQEFETPKGPAACMMLDLDRIPESVQWDVNIGLRNGWLGGDFEEVEYQKQLERAGLKLYQCFGAVFHHTGGRTSMRRFAQSDRHKTVRIMRLLIEYKYGKAPEDDDYFKDLKYIKADPNDDNKMALNGDLRECYVEVIRKNGLRHVQSFRKLGLV